jgi:hypothetical protein
MTDFASIGIQLDSRPLVDGAKAMDGVSEAAVRVDQRVGSMNGQMNDTAKIMRAQADQARATAAANSVLGNSTSQMTIGSQLFIEKLREQAATVGMSRSQLAAYQAAQLGVAREAEASVAKLKAYEDAIKAVADAKAAAAKQTNYLADSIKVLSAAYATLKIGEYIKDASLLAARYETLGVVTEVVGRNAGYTKTQMDTATDAIARQGITMVESRESAVKLVQAHVDLKNATVLARIAQDAAVIGHLNSSDAFDRLVNGISRGNVLILRNIGINVNLQTAYRQMADELGKTTKELTENERVQARLNAVVERGADIAGTYEAAMGTAGKQITSMQRYVQDLKTVVGETFLEVLTVSVMALTDSLKGANKEVSELSRQNQLHEWGAGIAQVFVSVADNVSNAIGAVKILSVAAAYAATSTSNMLQYNKDVLSAGFDIDKQKAAYAKLGAATDANVKLFADEKAAILAGEDKFQKAYDERSAAQLVRRKADAEAKLKVDQDYAAKATALLLANAGKPIAAQQAAQVALANSVYVGTPTYRDTEGREPTPKVDKVESTELADRLARIQDLVNAEKEMYDTMSKMDDMFHAAGKMGDEEFYSNKKAYAAAAAKDQIDGYTKQINDLKAYHNGTEAEAAKHAKQINDITAKRSAAEVKAQDERNLLDAKEFLRKEAIAAASDDATNKYLSGLDQEAKKLEESNAAHETSKGAVERETIARLDLAIAYQKQFIADQAVAGATAEEIAQAPATLKYLEDVRAARARIAAGLETQQANQFKDKSADQAIKDWQRAGQSIADSLTSAFGAGGKALGGMFQAYAKGMEGQLRAQKDLTEAKKKAVDDPDKIAAIQRAQLNGSLAQIQGYAGMTAAAQSYFAEGSRGYQVMHAATVALQGAEIALSLIKGVNAVLTQGEGDPYSAFARMAAMAAIVAGLGVAISGGGGGGGGQSAADVQKAQGTGSVFGDSTAKSDSIRRSIEALKENSDSMLPINQGMLTALKAIESAMTGLTNLVVRTTGLTDGTNLGIQTGMLFGGTPTSNLVASIGEKVFGTDNILGTLSRTLANLYSNTKQTIVDSGLQYGGSLRNLQQGNGFDQYASIDTTKSSFFGLSKKTTNSVQTAGLSDELSNQFGLIFTNLDTALQAASVALGGSAADVTKVLDNLTLESTKVSLKGLTGTALTDALNSVISKSMDEIATAVFPQFEAFRQVGEGYAETVLRLAGDYAKLDSILAASSSTFGATGIASVAARERLIALAGGIDELASQSNSFVDNFLSKAEQLAPVQKYVTDQLAAMGLQSLTTRDQFKDYVLGLASSGALATEAGATQYTALLALADAFAKTHAATEDLTKTEQEIADERKDLQQKLNELTMTSVQLMAKEREGIAAVNLVLYDQVKALEAFNAVGEAQANVQTAYYNQRNALQEIIDLRLKEAEATQKQIDALKLGDLSTLSPEQKYAEAQRQFDAAAPGDAKNAAAQTLLTASRSYNGSTEAYARDYAKVQAILGLQAASQKSAATVAQQQLDALDKQIGELVEINAGVSKLDSTMIELQKAILGLGSAMLALANANTMAGKPNVGNGASLGQSAVDGVLTGIYKDLLGRAPDVDGLKFWEGVAASGQTYDQIVAGFKGSDEYKALHGSHANGLEFVPFDGYRAELHRGERVQTASQVSNDKESNAQIVQLLGELVGELQADKEQRGAVAVATLKKLDTVANNLAATKRELARAE